MDGHARGNKLDIPVSYDDPYKDAVAVRHQLDSELKQETTSSKKNISSENPWPSSPPVSTRAATPDWQQRVPRSNSGGSESSAIAGEAAKIPSVKIRNSTPQHKEGPSVEFTDRVWPASNVAVLENPFLFDDSSDEIFDLLSVRSDVEIAQILKRLLHTRPTLRSVIKATIRQ